MRSAYLSSQQKEESSSYATHVTDRIVKCHVSKQIGTEKERRVDLKGRVPFISH